MNMSKEALRVVLEDFADQMHGRWYFRDGGGVEYGHTEEEALKIVEACLDLGVPVTDRLTAKAWAALVQKVTELEDRER
jgi:hypothetical protein